MKAVYDDSEVNNETFNDVPSALSQMNSYGWHISSSAVS